MNEPLRIELPSGPGAWQQALPELAPPPRGVPAAIQWQLLQHRVLLAIGGVFVLVPLLVFILPQLAAGERFESPWQLFPFLHLSVGLGMVIVPLILWRRRVAILRRGWLAPARIVAIQDQGTVRSPREESYGVRNADGPWRDYEPAFAQAKRFWASTLPVVPSSSPNAASILLSGIGCFATALGAFAILFMVVTLTLVWLSDQPIAEKGMWTLFCLGFLAAYLAAVWFGHRWVARMKRFAAGELTMGSLGVQSTVHCRFVFAGDGCEHEATAYMDLRPRLQTGQATPDDLAAYLPEQPQRALLLGGVWPPITIHDGQWARQAPAIRKSLEV